MMRRPKTVIYQECQSPCPPFFLASVELEDITTSRLLATWVSLSSTLQVRPLTQRGTNRPWHRPLLHSEMEPSLWPGIATSLRGKRLRQAYGGLLLSLLLCKAVSAVHYFIISSSRVFILCMYVYMYICMGHKVNDA